MINELHHELPHGWALAKIEDISETTSGGTPSRKNKNFFSGDIPWLKSGELEDNLNIKSAEEAITQQALDNSSAKIIPKGSILLALYGATVGKLGILGIDAAINQAICAIQPYQGVNARYLFYYLSNHRKNFLNARKGGAQPNISQGIVKTTWIPLAPTPEQYRIVGRVEVLFSYLDAGVAQLRAVQAQLKRYRQAVLKAAFEGKLTQQWRQAHKDQIEPAQKLLERIIKVKEPTNRTKFDKQITTETEELPALPDYWVWTKLGKIISVHSGEGLTTREMQKEGEYPVYGGNGISGYYNKYLFEDSKLIIGRVGAKCGVIHITTPKSWVTDNALVVDSWYMNISFLYYSLSNLNLNQFSVSTAQPVISSTKIYPLNFRLPPLMEQEQIVREIEYRLSISDEINKSILNIIKQADRLRQSVLKSAFEGKLVPQDPNDEPAEKLLERIRAERLANKSRNSNQVELSEYVE